MGAGSNATARSSRRTASGPSRALRVALATCAEVPAGDEDAPPLIDALSARGIEASPAVWDDDGVEWGGFDLVVVRSTWDYPDRRDEFLDWAESVPRVLNSPAVLRWNTDKTYLAALGMETIRTVFLEPGVAFVAPDEPFVVKPSVGAGSIGAARYDAGAERAHDHVRRLHAAGKTVMVQPFLEAVDHAGEVALHYLGGVFSHAVRKAAMLPRGGDPGEGLFVEERISAAEPSADELELAEQALDAVPFKREELLYARVDLLPGPVLLEVELTEPSLYLGYSEGAAERFADAVTAASQRRRMSAENGPIASQ
jgi:glutathione synthase/RimK-type ligase-like ATP-grasp enzyme